MMAGWTWRLLVTSSGSSRTPRGPTCARRTCAWCASTTPTRRRAMRTRAVRTVRTAQITSAYSTLLAHRPPPGPSEPPTFAPKVEDANLTDAAGRQPPGSARRRPRRTRSSRSSRSRDLVGVVSYVDRQSAVLETIVTPKPPAGQRRCSSCWSRGRRTASPRRSLGVESLGGHPPADLDRAGRPDRRAPRVAAPARPGPT